ncbi:hypothetical protein [Ruficoccus sp. ZRK36]|uniref:hypothetical protein n=1 Tax=Ruficoccus sp. ZRK36 TaxID=2866311 RepID=UPI001C735321|nr:hypothetical protein [Ruficoccus sp. ZRK36]QYY36842.1 hypothetical protein K0V07_05030 [Ruficoccus sp. ZRK36]
MHIVAGILFILISCLPLLFILSGSALLAGGVAIAVDEAARNMPPGSGDPAILAILPTIFGGFFATLIVVGLLFNVAIGVGIIISGRFLRQHRHYIFSFVVACLLCTSVPLGTILGIFTIVVLSRDSVKRLYGQTF